MRLGTVLAAAMIVMTACSSETTPAPATRTPHESVTSPTTGSPAADPVRVPGLPRRIDYVALGDSYTAGPMITVMRNDPDGCMRSQDNYPAFLAQLLDARTYTDRSCAAATTDDVSKRQALFDGTRARPQISGVTRQTDLVSIGLGGNDFGLFQSLLDCLPRGACTAADATSLADLTPRIAANVERVVADVRRRAPRAVVLVVGYPQVVPARGGCEGMRLTEPMRRASLEVAERLNAALRRAAARGPATYVDLAANSRGHDMCAGSAAWVNGPRGAPGIAAPFHPRIESMRNAAAVIYAMLTDQPAELPTELAEPDPASIR